MNMPYSTAKDAVEFWQPVADLFSLSVSLGYADAYRDSYVIVVGDQQGITLEEFTRDMLARCVLWLAERGGAVSPSTTKPGMFCFLMVQRNPDAYINVKVWSDCIFTAHRDAVLAVSGEGDKQ